MKLEHQLKLEELLQFLAASYILYFHQPAWWAYALLLLGPDVGMLGYLAGPRIGAFTYNLFHSKAVALVVAFSGFLIFSLEALMLAGVIMYGHASMDRIFGYGLKFQDAFKHTHLGWIGGEHGVTPQAGRSGGE